MRGYKSILQAATQPVAEQKGLRLQDIPDAQGNAQGNAGIASIFFAGDAAQARHLARAISAENATAYTLYDPDEVDYHVYTHWTPIVQKRVWNRAGMPWAAAPRAVDYSPSACPRTLDLLSRAVHIDVNPLHSSAEIEDIAEALAGIIARHG